MSLYTNLVSFWTLANTSTADSYGTNNLTASIGANAPTNATGPTSRITQATAFSGGGAVYPNMHISSNASLATTGSLFMSCWVYLASGLFYQTICGKIGNLGASSGIEYGFYLNQAASRFAFLISDGTTGYVANANTLGTPSLNTWYMLTGWYDSVGQTVNIVCNSQTTPDSASVSTGLQSSTNPFIMAANNNDLDPLNGQLASVGLWIGRTPTLSDLTTLWSNGLGQTWLLGGNYRPLVLRSGQDYQIEDQDILIIGSGITTNVGNLTISPTADGCNIITTPTGGTAASGSTPATAAGTVSTTGGQGGAATSTSGGTASAGGTITITGGQGGTGAASTNAPGNGGAITITGGAGGTRTSGFGNANGGNITIDGGAKAGSGTAGTVNIGTTNSTTINIGNSSSTTSFSGTVTGITASGTSANTLAQMWFGV